MDHARNLRCTRADMLGTDDEGHYGECLAAAQHIDELNARIKELEEGSCRYNCRTAKDEWIAGYMYVSYGTEVEAREAYKEGHN